MLKNTLKITSLFCLLVACQPEIPMVNLGINDVYLIERMRPLILHPEFTGDAYQWSMKDKQGNDSVISSERDYVFISAYPGEYLLKLNIIDDINPVKHEVKFIVWEEQVAYSRYISRVHEYSPAPGQFVNKLPTYNIGDTKETMRKKAEESIKDKNDVLISLGGFGGYVVFGFDHTVVNVKGEKDFKILGNAFYAAENINPDNPNSGGSAEPGIVMVSFDRNRNGLPDDEWYELVGSEYYKPETTHNYEITYHRPDANKVSTPMLGYAPVTDITYLPWNDNTNREGYMYKVVYHTQNYYPQWVEPDKITFSGTKLADNAVDISGQGIYYVLYTYDWGYVDNHPNEVEDKNSFDIDWAVDKVGNSVHLPGVDFIKVYTGVNQQCGWLGETSTEIARAEDLHVEDKKNYQ